MNPWQRLRKVHGRQVAKWLVLSVIAALVAVGVGAIVVLTGHLISPPPPSVDTQIGRLFRDAKNHGLAITSTPDLDMRGTGQKSRLVIFTPPYRWPGGGRSDEIRIYDVVNGRLKLAFSFQPTEVNKWVEMTKQHRKIVRQFYQGYVIEILNAGDTDGNGASEVIANFTLVFADGFIERPVVIYWDWKAERFRLKPLLYASTQFSSPNRIAVLHKEYGKAPLNTDWAPGYRGAYLHLVKVIDRNSRKSFRSLGGQFFVLINGKIPTLVGGFVVEAGPCHLCISKIQVIGWSLDLSTSYKAYIGCDVGRKPLVVRVSGARDYTATIRRAWLRASVKYCY